MLRRFWLFLALAVVVASAPAAAQEGPKCGSPDEIEAELTGSFLRFFSATRIAPGLAAELWASADGAAVATVLRLARPEGIQLCIASVALLQRQPDPRHPTPGKPGDTL